MHERRIHPSLLTRQPFEPFEVRMTNGDTHSIRHPENAWLAGSRLFHLRPRRGTGSKLFPATHRRDQHAAAVLAGRRLRLNFGLLDDRVEVRPVEDCSGRPADPRLAVRLAWRPQLAHLGRRVPLDRLRLPCRCALTARKRAGGTSAPSPRRRGCALNKCVENLVAVLLELVRCRSWASRTASSNRCDAPRLILSDVRCSGGSAPRRAEADRLAVDFSRPQGEYHVPGVRLGDHRRPIPPRLRGSRPSRYLRPRPARPWGSASPGRRNRSSRREAGRRASTTTPPPDQRRAGVEVELITPIASAI